MHPDQADLSGRRIYGNSVHLDFFPLRYVLAAIVISITSFVVPTIVTVVAVCAFSGTAMYNLAAMRPQNYKRR